MQAGLPCSQLGEVTERRVSAFVRYAYQSLRSSKRRERLFPFAVNLSLRADSKELFLQMAQPALHCDGQGLISKGPATNMSLCLSRYPYLRLIWFILVQKEIHAQLLKYIIFICMTILLVVDTKSTQFTHINTDISVCAYIRTCTLDREK